MALNGLAGAGQSKTTLLESKGIFEEKPTGEFMFLGGMFNRKKLGSGSSSPKKPSPQQQPDKTVKETAEAVREKEREAGVGGESEAQTAKTKA